MAKKDLLATISETVVGGGATGTSSVPTPTGGTATLPNSKKQGDSMEKGQNPGNTPIEDTSTETNTAPTGDASAANKATIATKPSAAASTVKEDVEAMLDGFDLSEEFKTQASTLFEAAVASRIAEERVAIEEEFAAKQTELEEQYQAAQDEFVEEVAKRVDDYLGYVVNEWMEDNKVAIEHSLRTELTEELISGIKSVFEQSHVTLPEEQVDVVESLAARVEELEAQLNATLDENIELTSALKESVKNEVFASVAEGLAMTQVEKFRTLAEGVEFGDADSYEQKLQLVKEQYFGEKKAAKQLIEEREMVELTEEKTSTVSSSNPVANYVTAISRTVKK
jgi:hypothetical protein